ncbi:MAG: hypothetical protein WCB12_23635 [Bryobacteraceae bacterium]
MGERPATDSRRYIVAFELRSKADCPPDFELPPSLTAFDTGLFLPRDDPDWFGRSSYPPRIVLLNDGGLHIFSHPSAGEPPRQFAMEQIASVESGHMLLKGWLRFTGPDFDFTIRYNTRGFLPVFRFMRRFRDKLLHGAQPGGTPEVRFGGDLDNKFANALEQELDPGEVVLMRIFQPPREVRSRSWLLPRRQWIAGDLLALTARRLLWITDRERKSYSRYGTIASYAPCDALLSIGLTTARRKDILHVGLNTGSSWQVPMASEGRWDCRRLAEDFAAALEIQKRSNEAARTEVGR